MSKPSTPMTALSKKDIVFDRHCRILLGLISLMLSGQMLTSTYKK